MKYLLFAALSFILLTSEKAECRKPEGQGKYAQAGGHSGAFDRAPNKSNSVPLDAIWLIPMAAGFGALLLMRASYKQHPGRIYRQQTNNTKI